MHEHLPVLVHQVLDLLRPQPGKCYLDGTFGAGGHTRALLEADSDCRVVALDRDPATHSYAERVKREFGDRFTFYDFNFADLSQLADFGFAGALFDLGVSSMQLDSAERGFSFRLDGSIDMRMDPRSGRSANCFLSNASEAELVEAVRDYGEEPRWRRVVRAILEARGTPVLQSTTRFAELIARAVGRQGRRSRTHPATRTFQGIRIALNDEINALKSVLSCAFNKLAPKGVLAVISFHSLEDRCVKRYFKRLAGRAEHLGDHRPQDERHRKAELLTPRPLKPDADEVASNPRSRSAKLRAVRKEVIA